DSEFDLTDSDEDSEFDETDNDEEEQEQGEEEWEDNGQDEFKDAEEHNNADDRHVGTLTSIHNDSDPLFDDIPEEDKDLTKSPAAAALARIELRNGKRPLRATDDLRTTFGSSMNIQRSTVSTLDARPNARLSRPIQPALEGQSNHFQHGLFPNNLPLRNALALQRRLVLYNVLALFNALGFLNHLARQRH
ncbi:hypothetical protein EC957_001345, partial [Mortierella hygrophila]